MKNAPVREGLEEQLFDTKKDPSNGQVNPGYFRQSFSGNKWWIDLIDYSTLNTKFMLHSFIYLTAKGGNVYHARGINAQWPQREPSTKNKRGTYTASKKTS